MFKRGDIVEYCKDIYVYKNNMELVATKDGDTVSGLYWNKVTPYTGPIYEKGGQRFVPSGEFRDTKMGDYYWGLDSGQVGQHTEPYYRDETCHENYRPILLPVPTLEPEHEFKEGDWVRRKCDGYVEAYKPTGPIGYINDMWERLPGRPLTTDDLMQLCGKVVIRVFCNACECDSVTGNAYTALDGMGVVNFFHIGSESAFAWFRTDGSIVFADGVEGNIFVIEEGT